MNKELSVNKKKERIAWIDIAKCICIFMVLFSHMEYVPEFLQCIFKPFFLTTFFFLTGYVFNADRPFKTFILNRIRTLLFPALLFSVIYLLDFQAILHGDYSLQALANDLNVLFRQQRGQGDMLWFLYVSFLAEIPLFFMMKYIKDKRITFALSFALCELSIIYVKHFMTNVPYWYAHIVFVAMFFMVAGCILKDNELRIQKLFDNSRILVLLSVIYLVTVFMLYYKFGVFVNINDYAANQIIWFLVVISGIYICISVAKKIPPFKILTYCGKHTLIFYLLHDRVRGVINLVLKRTAVWDLIFINSITKTVAVFVICFVEVLILMCASEIISRYVPFIVGRKYKRESR